MVYTDDRDERAFAETVDQMDLVWHRDPEDRAIQVIGTTDWKIQLDNELPRDVDGVHIPAGVWHRLIKGTGQLNINIQRQ